MSIKIKQGYIALVSVLLISGILLASLLETSYGAFFGTFNILRSQDKTESRELAESCLQVALVRLAENSNYQPILAGDLFSFDQKQCRINSIISLPTGIITVSTSAMINRSITNLVSTLSLINNQFSITSIKEI